jgi:DNA-binding PucR family transcriptional regulator
VAESAAALTAVADAYAGARDALLMAERLGRRGLFQTDDLALERALAADERLLADAVERELGPILAARRNADSLIVTLRAFLESGHNLRATARRLGLAPRTVAYRIERIERLLGGPVGGERALRAAAALLGARLLSGDVGGETAPTAGAAAGATAAGRSRPAPHDRSRNRRRRATAT